MLDILLSISQEGYLPLLNLMYNMLLIILLNHGRFIFITSSTIPISVAYGGILVYINRYRPIIRDNIPGIVSHSAALPLVGVVTIPILAGYA